MSEAPKKRGRPPLPPLTPEEIEARRIARNKKAVERQRKTGYAAQKRYKAAHPEQRSRARSKTYEPTVRIPIEFKKTLEDVVKNTNMSITQLFVSAVEEKYGVTLHHHIDKNKKM